MYPTVKKASTTTEFETPERCFITEISNDQDDPDVSIARARVEAGVTTAWHKLIDIDERYLIMSGEGFVEVGDDLAIKVGVRDVVRIPANMPQRIRNTGMNDLIFYAICSPRFQQSCYVKIE